MLEIKMKEGKWSLDMPDYTRQKAEIQPLLSQKLEPGDEW